MATEIKGLKISQIPEVTKLTGNEMIPCEYSGTNGKFDAVTLANYVTELNPYDPEGKIKQLREDVDNLESEVSQITNNISDLNNHVTENTENITKLKNMPKSVLFYDNTAQFPSVGSSESLYVDTLTTEVYWYDHEDQYIKINKQVYQAPSKETFPSIGNQLTIYVSKSENKLYRWDGGKYVELSQQATTNNPDNEDLTAEENVLKFANKNYSADTFSGLGRVFLRKNISGGKNILTQEVFTGKTNVRFVIQYDYDLNGGIITLPENCVLDFQGGSIKNGTVIGNNTLLIANGSRYLFNTVAIDGSFKNSDVYYSWFKESENATNNLINLINLSKSGNCVVHIDANISVSLSNVLPHISVFSNTKIVGGIITQITSNQDNTYAIFETSKDNENITFENITIYGDALTNSNASNADIQMGHGIRINGGKNITISNCYITQCMGDGINIQVGSAGVEKTFPETVKIIGCTCNNNRRLGIAVEGGKNIVISDCECCNNGRITTTVYPASGIDIEPWTAANYVDGLTISNCLLKNNREYSLCIYSVLSDDTKNISIKGCNLDNILTRTNSYPFEMSDCTFKLGAFRSSKGNLNGCNIKGYLNFIEDTSPNIFNMNNCYMEVSGADCLYNDYSVIRFGKSSGNLALQHELNIYNSIIAVSDLTNCYRLFSAVYGDGDCFIKLYNTSVKNTANISVLDYVSEYNNCILDVGSNSFVLPNRLKGRAFICRNTTFLSTRKKLLVPGTATYVNRITPYDVILDCCSFNPTTTEDQNTSIDSYIDLGYIPSVHTFSILFQNPIFPKGTSYDASNLQTNKYYNIRWMIYDQDLTVKNTGNTDGRPTSITSGFSYFDTSLNKPIWWTGSKWVDSDGTET